MKKVYIVWAWWIGLSWIARYYKENWYEVYGSDACSSELTDDLNKEGINIKIWVFPEQIDSSFEKIIYTEAVPLSQEELVKAKELNVPLQTYPESLAEIANKKKLIAVAWTHWKSTTTSMASIMLKDSKLWVNALVWTILKEFWSKNTYFSDSDYFALEACEYKRSFTKYTPFITIITNIDLDHLDYFKDLEDYISAYEELISNMKPWGYVILNGDCDNSMKLLWKKDDLTYIKVFSDSYEITWEKYILPEFKLQIPWEHIKFDSNLAFVLWKITNIPENEIITSLESYSGVWRRMETITITKNNNRIMSDYGHHPEEIIPTLKAIKEGYSPEKLIVCFQPHQYSRTIELLEEFKDCFNSADTLIIPDIYESRDSEENKIKMTPKKFTEEINHPNKIFWDWLEKSWELLLDLEKNNKNSIILLMWAWSVDNLRNIFIK